MDPEHSIMANRHVNLQDAEDLYPGIEGACGEEIKRNVTQLNVLNPNPIKPAPAPAQFLCTRLILDHLLTQD